MCIQIHKYIYIYIYIYTSLSLSIYIYIYICITTTTQHTTGLVRRLHAEAVVVAEPVDELVGAEVGPV